MRAFLSWNEGKAGNKPANRYWIHIKKLTFAYLL
jgi:hypothetical protein